MGWTEDFARYGPGMKGPADLAEARRYVEALARSHYENFPVLSVFIPGSLRPHFAAVYAYCRWADDLADEVPEPARSLELLDWWEDELHRCYAGSPRHPVMVALAPTIRDFAIPPEPFLDLLRAFRQDQHQTRYADFDQLLEYCRYSANPVGRIVLRLCRVEDSDSLWRADQICTGLQLANFWQDVRRDADRGRIYLPADERERLGVREEDIAAGRFSPAFRSLLAALVARTERFLRDGLPLAHRMPGRLKLVVSLFAQGGLAILRKIQHGGYDVLTRRPRLHRRDLPLLVARSVVSGLFDPRARDASMRLTM